MTIHCAAVYENGILRPTRPIALPEEAEVHLAVMPVPATGTPTNIADVLAAIAQMPVEGDDQGFSGRDHDRVLYGDGGRP